MPTTRGVLAFALHLSGAMLMCAAAIPALRAAEAGQMPAANAAGYEIELDQLPSPHPRPTPRPAPDPNKAAEVAPLCVKVGIPWSYVEKTQGQYDWSVVDEIVLSHADAGYEVVLAPHGDNAIASSPEGGWTDFLRALAGRYRDRVDHYMLGRNDGLFKDLAPRDFAFRLKLSSVTIQSADPGAKIVLGDIDASSGQAGATLEALYREEVAVYLDAVAVIVAGAAPGGAETAAAPLAAVKAQMLLNDPSAQLWLSGIPVPGGRASGGRLLRAYLEGLRQEAALCLFKLDFGPDGMPALLPALERIRDEFHPTYAPLVESGRGLQVLTPMGQHVAVTTVRLFDPEAKTVLIAYDAGEGATRGAQAVLAVDSIDLADPVLKDIAAGESAPVGAFQKDDAAGLTRLAVPLADYPLLLEYRRFTSPLFGEEEKLQVTGKRLPSVEEILAHYQAFQAAQDALLVNLRADARVDYHFRIGGGSTIDVTVMNVFYLDRTVGAEFEQREFFVNGVKWRSDRIPEFPLPQPEKVMTLPLDISLDKRYAYRLAGEETVDGYDCWTVDFDPIAQTEGQGSLKKGRVWIDKKTFARVQISSVQTGLKPPIISNDEKDSYRPVHGPEGLEYWLLSRIDGQQVFSTNGRNLVLAREVTFSGHVLNDASFGELRRQAYASQHQILRDTPAGQRYLERTPQGDRVVKNDLDRDNLFLLGGVFYNRSLDFPVPLAGVNYFNRDVGGHGIQTNIFYGGVLLFANASHPDMFGTGLEGSADLVGQGFSTTDRPVKDGEEVDRENVDLTRQRLSVGLGLPFANYWKVKWTAGLEFDGFARDKDTGRGFVIPQDNYVTTVGMEGEFNRKSWTVSASADVSRRDRWSCWGNCDPNAPPSARDFSQEAKDYVQYEGTLAKDIFLPWNQKIHASVSSFGGVDLDRFSKYRFDFFGNRLRGLSGEGFRYTNGLKGQVQYAFNLGNIIRFEATVDHARVKDSQFPEPGSNGYKDFTGVGLSGQTILGPNLIVSLDWGIAVASDINKFRGDQEILLTILRLFR